MWTKEITRSDTQYWFGDSLLIAGVYEPGVETAKVYLPDASGSDPGFLNVNAPYQFLKAGAWHEISSTWHTSIPVLARVGSAIPTGKSKPTTSVAGDDPEFPNLAKDDVRAVEIYPPPLEQIPHWPKEFGQRKAPVDTEIKWFSYSWLEDDGQSPVDKVEAVEVTVKYGVSGAEIRVKVELKKEGQWEPLWLKDNITVVLPVGEERTVKSEDGKDAHEDLDRDDKGRRIWKVKVDLK